MIDSANYLHRAPFVVPMLSDPAAPSVIEDGAVLTNDGRIEAVGRFVDLKACGAEVVDHEGAVLTPGLVNCHTHLELSHLFAQGRQETPPGDITDWIRQLLTARQEAGIDEEHTFVAWQALARLYGSGCRAVADIGNLPDSSEIGQNFKVNLLFFLEIMGLAGEKQLQAITLLDTLPDTQACTAHALYSSGPQLIKRLKDRANRLNSLFPIHLAESRAESEFLANGKGPLREFLAERQAWDESFVVPGLSPVAYLDELGALDEKTLCVHCVQVDQAQIELIADRGAKVCLCPGSNRYLGVGKAPVGLLLAQGIMPVIGTDSLASNPELNLWREMRILLEDHPQLAPATVFLMASRRGAEVLGLASETGSLSPGCSASFLAVRGEATPAGAGDVFPFLATVGEAVITEWVE
ncbi:MAG: amidohydrolase family protein [Proteobacteria bacterium]|nr:amidohydrolase family protein [Pseudomonadota bacterium]MBU1714108.1 amidohydrolase family protein [Pseudomonadota bacterium]